MFQTPATQELAQAIGQIGRLPELKGPEAESHLAQHLRKLQGVENHVSRKTPQGKTKVYVPRGAIMTLYGRKFMVTESARRYFYLEVDSLPEAVKEGKRMDIFGALFRIEKITLPQSKRQQVRIRMIPDNARTLIDPQPLPRHA